MRDWNPLLEYIETQIENSLLSAYEGLKPQRLPVDKVRKTLGSLLSAYEGLKPAHVPVRALRSGQCLLSAYEGLKREIRKEIEAQIEKFIKCLWGIETPWQWKVQVTAKEFIKCLWGIETFVIKKDDVGYLYGLLSAYEGLKHGIKELYRGDKRKVY